jgi:Clp amino terminal domain, pathogenicity island component
MDNAALTNLLARLTGQARRAIVKAYREAQSNHDDYVGTEHLLVGLLHEPDTGAILLLRLLNTDPERMQKQIRVLLQGREPGGETARLPLTPRAKRVLGLAAEEADRAGQAHVGTEHFLIGLSREDESLAHFLLAEMAITADQLRAGLARLPPSENRDQLVQAATPLGAAMVRADPNLDEVQRLLLDNEGIAAGRPETAAPQSASGWTRVSGWTEQYENLRRQLRGTQVLLGLFIGTAVGATMGTWKMVLCMFAGVVAGVLRRSWLGALGGAWAGLGIARAVCPGQLTEALLLILVGILAGMFVGDGPAHLLAGYRGDQPPRPNESSDAET